MEAIINWFNQHAYDALIYAVTKETGILIGVGLLILASGYLPKKVRLHVLTGGISIALYQIGKNYYFRQQWKETEEERARLKQEKQALQTQGQEILQELNQLKARSKALNKEISELKAERERLRDQDDFDPNSFDSRIEALKNESQDIDKLLDELPIIGKEIGETTHQLDTATR